MQKFWMVLAVIFFAMNFNTLACSSSYNSNADAGTDVDTDTDTDSDTDVDTDTDSEVAIEYYDFTASVTYAGNNNVLVSGQENVFIARYVVNGTSEETPYNVIAVLNDSPPSDFTVPEPIDVVDLVHVTCLIPSDEDEDDDGDVDQDDYKIQTTQSIPLSSDGRVIFGGMNCYSSSNPLRVEISLDVVDTLDQTISGQIARLGIQLDTLGEIYQQEKTPNYMIRQTKPRFGDIIAANVLDESQCFSVTADEAGNLSFARFLYLAIKEDDGFDLSSFQFTRDGEPLNVAIHDGEGNDITVAGTLSQTGQFIIVSFSAKEIIGAGETTEYCLLWQVGGSSAGEAGITLFKDVDIANVGPVLQPENSSSLFSSEEQFRSEYVLGKSNIWSDYPDAGDDYLLLSSTNTFFIE